MGRKSGKKRAKPVRSTAGVQRGGGVVIRSLDQGTKVGYLMISPYYAKTKGRRQFPVHRCLLTRELSDLAFSHSPQ